MPETEGMSTTEFARLLEAIDFSARQLEMPRRNRLEQVKQLVGSHYSDGGADKRVPTNFIELASTIYLRKLAAKAPRARVSTKKRELKPYAYSTELAINQVPEEIGLGKTIRRAVLEAIFSVGVVKVGISSSGAAVLGRDPGQVYVDVVPLDDYVVDMTAKSRDAVQWEGNDYWIDLESAHERYGYSDSLEGDDETTIGERGEERAESVSQDGGAHAYRDRLWCRDVYIYKTNQLITYAVKSRRILRVADWDGPEGGPYRVLGFSEVPGNILPLPPVSLWADLHELGNALFRKLGRQADAKKTVAAFAGGNDEAVDRLRAASDGDGIRYDGQPPGQISVGGIDQPTLAFFLQVNDLFDMFAGNLTTLGGLGPSSDTLGQDRLITQAAGARMQDMADRTIDFAREIFKSLAWYEWTDPIRVREIEKSIPKTDLYLRREWSEETREGNFIDYNFEIDPYSMQDNSPATQLQKLTAVMQTYVLPLMPAIQAQGGQIDVPALLSMVGDLSNLPELADIVSFEGAPPIGDPVQAANQQQPSFKPAQTERTYTRINRPGATRQGRNQILANTLLGVNSQEAEQDAIGRRTG